MSRRLAHSLVFILIYLDLRRFPVFFIDLFTGSVTLYLFFHGSSHFQRITDRPTVSSTYRDPYPVLFFQRPSVSAARHVSIGSASSLCRAAASDWLIDILSVYSISDWPALSRRSRRRGVASRASPLSLLFRAPVITDSRFERSRSLPPESVE